jgi:hypothetical protein
MSFVDDDDTFTELAEAEKRRKERRRSSAPYLRLLAAALVVLVLIAAGVVGVRSWLQGREESSYRDYMAEVTEMVKTSDKMGVDLSQLLMEPGDSTRKDVQTKLDQYIQSSQQLSESAKGLSAPEDLLEAHQWFAATMQLRSRGLENLKPSLMNALEVKDEEVTSDQIARAMQLLLLSDVAYQEFFLSRASEVLKTKSIDGLSVPDTTFVSDSSLASKTKVKEILATLKSSDNLQSIHGVALAKVVAMPAEKQLEEGSTTNLQSTDELSFDVTVENQGNEIEKDVPVTLTLNVEENPQPQILTVKVAEIKPNEQKVVRIAGVQPTDYGLTAALEVKVGPVPDEKMQENNVLSAYVIFVL